MITTYYFRVGLLIITKLFLLLSTSFLTESQPVLRFSNLSTTDGLPNNVIKSIVQDNTGFLWFATQNGLSRYDGYDFVTIENNEFNSFNINTLYSENNYLWIGTKTKGLFLYQNGTFNSVSLGDKEDNSPIQIKKIIKHGDNNILVATSNGIYNINIATENKVLLDFLKGEHIVSIEYFNNSELIIITKTKAYQLNFLTNINSEIVIRSEGGSVINNLVFKDKKNNIWLGTRKGLYTYKNSCNCFRIFNKLLQSSNIYSFTSDNDNLLIGTIANGLYFYNYDTNSISHYENNPLDNKQLSDVNIVSLFIDRNNILWIGTFHSGLDFINLSYLHFGIISYRSKDLNCAKNYAIYDMFEETPSVLWVATDDGLIKVDKQNHTCKILLSDEKDPHTLSSNTIRSFFIDSQNNHWIGTSEKLNKYNPKTDSIDRLDNLQAIKSIVFIIEYKQNALLLGNINGLYIYDLLVNEISKVKFNSNVISNIRFNNYSQNNKNEYIFSTNHGIFKLNNNFELENVPIDFNNKKDLFVTALYGDNQGGIWFGTRGEYFLYLDHDGKVENFTNNLSMKNIEVQSILSGKNNLWISSSNGIFKFNTRTNRSIHYTYTDGLQEDGFFFTSNYKSRLGKLYFGGKKGFNSFYPKFIPNKLPKPNVVISNISIQGDDLHKGDKTQAGYIIGNTINNLSNLVLSYKDQKIDIDFSALDFSDSNQNNYAYRLIGYSDKWNHAISKNRRATYTNLKAGNYIFQLKGANKYGIWSEKIKELRIKVNPAPWLTIWAYFVYFIVVISLIWCFIRYKTIASRKRAKQLEATVAERTHEVILQKKMVESLLEHKNEVFANITHEFNTPLSLILGPTEQLVAEPELLKHAEKLNMIQRNSKRLILMVGQILKLSQAELDKEVLRESQSVKSTLLMLYESFLPLTQNKNINITLRNNHDVNIYATSECLEIVVGNLLSNALKFTNSGGHIDIYSEIDNNNIKIIVKDTGSGIESKNLDMIFKRFVRLDAHKSIAGTGIGLAVVKEIAQANNGQIMVQSEWGNGSLFTVVFPISDVINDSLMEQKEEKELLKQLVENTKNELKTEKTIVKSKIFKNRISILIIEDNVDMQTHIGSVLNNRFNCYFADRGRRGIAIALKNMPDIVICDVMMPGMDGYQVTRILRHDGRTSHIPIILLTALNTKESRIKGWRENIDTYITKPFDALELNVQIDNILNIRQILQKKTGIAIKTNSSSGLLELPKKDSIFIEKLQDVIGKYYTNEYFQKADLASKMAVSERHLYRKIKALVGESPMDMLRDYRLEKSAIKLKDGYQVGLTSDECGFSSVSYFGSCFKKKYGITPKQYQKLNYKQ